MGTRAGRGTTTDDGRPRRPAEPAWRKAIRDLLSLAFVIGAIVAGIRAGRATDDIGLGIGVGFAVCFVGAVVISRTVLAPDQKPAPRWAVVMSLVTSPLVIAAGVIELRADEHPVGDLRLFCGVAGLLFGLDQWAQRGRLRRRNASAEAARRRADLDSRFPVVPASVFAALAADPPSPAAPGSADAPGPATGQTPSPDSGSESDRESESDLGTGSGTRPRSETTTGTEVDSGVVATSEAEEEVADEEVAVPFRRPVRIDGPAPSAPGAPNERHLTLVSDEGDGHGLDDDEPDESDDVDMLPPHRW